MADMELVEVDEGAPTQEPETVAEVDVAQSDTEQVAEEAATPEAISIEDFDAWKSKQDLKYRELETENETLRAKTATKADGPTPEETNRYNDLASQFQQMQKWADETEDADERAQAMYQVGMLQNSLIDAETTLVARTVGIDPNMAEFQQALKKEQISSGKDIERIAWMVKAQAKPEHQETEVLKEREKKMTKAESTFDDKVKAEVAKQVAGIRQELGMNATPSTQPAGGGSPRAQLERAIQDAKDAGDTQEYLRGKAILNQLID